MSILIRSVALAFPIVSVFVLRYLESPLAGDLVKLLTFVGALNVFLWGGGNVRVALNRNATFLIFGLFVAIVVNVAAQVLQYQGFDRSLLLGATILAFVQILDPVFRGLGLAAASHLVVSKSYLIIGFFLSLILNSHLIYTIVGLSMAMFVILLVQYRKEFVKLKWERLGADDGYVYCTSISNYLISNLDILLFSLVADEAFLVNYYLITRIVKIVEPVFSAITHQFVFDLKDMTARTAKRLRFNKALRRNVSVALGWFVLINFGFYVLADAFQIDFPFWMFTCLSASFSVLNIYSGIGYFLISLGHHRHNLWISLVPPFIGILYLTLAYTINSELYNVAVVYYVGLVAVLRFSFVAWVLRVVKP